VNRKLEDDGQFVCCLETTRLRRKRIFNIFPRFLCHIIYFFDYLFYRVIPTVPGIRWINDLSSNRNRPVSYYEMVGRLSYCGFETVRDEEINGHHYLVARKTAEPPAQIRERYGLLLGLDRIGRNGNKIRIYKFRTMVAFSEYVQEHIYRRNNLCEKGKFKNDRRVTVLGGFFRKFWLDELPMIYNMLRGEIKLVGVRPVSQQYLSLYDPEVVKLRTSVKPGLIPPFYADLPVTLKEIQESEVHYIRQWQEAPLRTDLVYFFRVLKNILFHGARSK
ncbi:MAG: sugar transferase, partial [Bacteroidota bacterium]